MTDLKIKKAQDETEVEKATEKAGEKVLTPFKGQVPCYWQITKTETGIFATNSETNESFEGSVESFNERLRG
jgi:hypothetical protein